MYSPVWYIPCIDFRRFLYWTHPYTISRMGMDGSNIKDIVTTNITWIGGVMAVDFYSERIWWSDYHGGHIE